MFVYNITIKVDIAIADGWLQWHNEEHIPAIMSTGLFIDYKFFQLIEQDDSEGPTYVIQYFVQTKNNYEIFIEKFAPLLIKKSFEKWGDGFITFSTLLKVMH